MPVRYGLVNGPGGLIGLAVLALAVLGVVWLVRSLSGPVRGNAEDSAERELRCRYATGGSVARSAASV